MDRDIELALKTLNNEFRAIKTSLEPLSEEFKKLNSLEIELKKLKSEIIPKIKDMEMRVRESVSAPKDIRLAEQYKALENQMNKIRMEMLAYRKKSSIDREQDSALCTISEKQGLIDVKLRKLNREFEERYKKQIESNREMIINLVSENNKLKHDFAAATMEFEKLKKEMQILQARFQERDTQLTKDINIRKRHINQIVDEINEFHKKIHFNGSLIAENQEKIDDIKSQIAKIKNDIQNLEKSNSTKVDMKNIDDTKTAFSRLEKKTISDIGEIKARMLELERKVVGKKDIDRIQTSIDEIQTKEINKLKEEFSKLSAELTGLPKHVETKLSNLKRVMNYIELIKSDLDKLNSRTGTIESKLFEANKIKSELENLREDIKHTPASKEELTDALNYFEVIKRDNENIKKELAQAEARINKLLENSADISFINTLKKDVATAIAKAEKISSISDVVEHLNQKLSSVEDRINEKLKNMASEMERINIKAENASKILKEMDKVL